MAALVRCGNSSVGKRVIEAPSAVVDPEGSSQLYQIVCHRLFTFASPVRSPACCIRFSAPSVLVKKSSPEAEFIDSWMGDKDNSGIGLSYRPASHVAWRAGIDFVPNRGSLNSATERLIGDTHFLKRAACWEFAQP
jgi:hypothetical protein